MHLNKMQGKRVRIWLRARGGYDKVNGYFLAGYGVGQLIAGGGRVYKTTQALKTALVEL